jgi:hypothetical protein
VDAKFKEINELELLIATSSERRAYWRQRAYDGSVYAPSGHSGKVVAAYFEVDGLPCDFAPFERAGVAVIEVE